MEPHVEIFRRREEFMQIYIEQGRSAGYRSGFKSGLIIGLVLLLIACYFLTRS